MSIERHTPGTFCWFELATTDQRSAKQFYQSLFGWEAADSPIGPDEVYTIFKRDGRDVGAAYTMRPEQRFDRVESAGADRIAHGGHTGLRDMRGAEQRVADTVAFDDGVRLVLQHGLQRVRLSHERHRWQGGEGTRLRACGVPGFQQHNGAMRRRRC